MDWRYNVAALGAAPVPGAPRRTAASAPATTMPVRPSAFVVRTHPASHAFVASEGRCEQVASARRRAQMSLRTGPPDVSRSSIGRGRDVTHAGRHPGLPPTRVAPKGPEPRSGPGPDRAARMGCPRAVVGVELPCVQVVGGDRLEVAGIPQERTHVRYYWRRGTEAEAAGPLSHPARRVTTRQIAARNNEERHGRGS